jgi:hypothetical protein
VPAAGHSFPKFSISHEFIAFPPNFALARTPPLPYSLPDEERKGDRRPFRAIPKGMHSENHDDSNSGEFELQNSKEFIPLSYDPRDFHPSDPRATGLCTPEDAANIIYPHGRSQTFILRHENPAEYEALHKKWWDEYQPSGHIEETLVQLLVDNHWLFKRARLRLEQVEWEMPLNAKHWIDDYQKLVETFTRFKNTAERAFQRSFREVELHFRECVRTENAAHKADLLRLKIEAQIADKPAEAKQIALKLATPLYRDRRERAAARAKMHLVDPNDRLSSESVQLDVVPPHRRSPLRSEES